MPTRPTRPLRSALPTMSRADRRNYPTVVAENVGSRIRPKYTTVLVPTREGRRIFAQFLAHICPGQPLTRAQRRSFQFADRYKSNGGMRVRVQLDRNARRFA